MNRTGHELRAWMCLWAACSLVLPSCHPPTPANAVSTSAPAAATATAPAAASIAPAGPPARGSAAIDPDATSGSVTIALPVQVAAAARATVADLAPAEIAALVERLEPVPASLATGSAAPTLRAPTLPPPRAGATEPIAFIAANGKTVADPRLPAAPTAPPLHPLTPPQIAPTGEVRAESEIRVHFDEPMVAVAQVGSQAIPAIAISPAVAGHWRWIDTRVAEFAADGPRLPAATEYTVTVAAGARALSGDVLAAPAVATFSTPPLAIAGAFPRTPMRPDSAIAIELDQDFDPAAVVAHVQIEQVTERVVRGTTEIVSSTPLKFHPISLAQAEASWRKNPHLAYDEHARTALGSRYLLVAPDSAWPAGAKLRVELAKGTPSREGARLSTGVGVARLDVAPAFRALGIQCDDMKTPVMIGAPCSAWGTLTIEFSNAVDAKTYRSQDIQLAGQAFADNQPSGSSIQIATPTVVGQPFHIDIGGTPTDIYGQALVGARRLELVTTRERFDAALTGPTGMITLDPRFTVPQWVLQAGAIPAIRVQLYRVTPADYFAYYAFDNRKRATPPGAKVYDQTIAIGARTGADIRIDLRPALSAAGTGHVIAVAAMVPPPPKHDDYEDRPLLAWIQVTKLGVVARVDDTTARAWVHEITPSQFLSPVAGATADVLLDDGTRSPASAASGTDGGVAFTLPPPPSPSIPQHRRAGLARWSWYEPTAVLAIHTATDSAFATFNGDGRQIERTRDALWYATDDRFTYKPGEPLYLKGWLRWTGTPESGPIAPRPGDLVHYALRDAGNHELAAGDMAVTDQGGFDAKIDIPTNATLGGAQIILSTAASPPGASASGGADAPAPLGSLTHTLPIAIEEFRTPAYAVALDDDVGFSGALPVIVGDQLEMRADAKYYTGGGLPGAQITWAADLREANYRPPGWDGFDFSPPDARDRRGAHAIAPGKTPQPTEVAQLTGASTSTAVFGIAALPDDRASTLTVDATVVDVDRIAIRATSRTIIVHPSAYYVGLHESFVHADTLEVIATDIDGHAVVGVPIDVEVSSVLHSELAHGDARPQTDHVCHLTSAAVPVECAWGGGDWLDRSYNATARVVDPRGRANTASRALWGFGVDAHRPLALVADRKLYRPGDKAKLEIHSDSVPATAIVSFMRGTIMTQRQVELTAAVTPIELPIEPGYIPSISVAVDRVAKRKNTLKGSELPLPASAQAELELPVDIDSARLAVAAHPTQKIVEPGAPATFDIEVRRDGQPIAGAEVALVVVDEAVLALSHRDHADPLAPFYPPVRTATQVIETFDSVLDEGDELADGPGVTRYKLDEHNWGMRGGSGYGFGGGGTIGHGHGGMSSTVIQARKDLRATAVFSPRLHTDRDGRAHVTVTMPDSLTRFRIVALATANTRWFGKGEDTIVTQRKVSARIVAPRFLSQGDAFALPVVVQNLDRVARDVEVAVRGTNLIADGSSGKRVTVEPGQRAELRFGFHTAARGTAVVQTIAMSGATVDAQTLQIPVYEPATTEAFATYGVITDAAQREQLAVPADLFTDVGGLEVELASTQLQELTDSFLYIYRYPFECNEQRSARMLATAALADVLDAFAAPGRPTHAEIEATRARDLGELSRSQNKDGGWGYWPDGKTDPFVTQQVLRAIVAAHGVGPARTRAIQYVTADADRHRKRLDARAAIRANDRDPREPVASIVDMESADLIALAAAGVDATARAEHLHAVATALAAYPLDAKARVLSLLAGRAASAKTRGELLAQLASAIHETADAATATTEFAEGEKYLLVSNAKSTSLVLDALIREAPQQPVITKLARGLLSARRRGRWVSTQENVAVLAAMRRYFDAYEKETPAFTGQMWIADAGYAEHAFAGRSTARETAKVGWPALGGGAGARDITLAKDGTGRMYYRIGITYAPKRTDLPALDAGFIVRRDYSGADHPDDVRRGADGRIHIKLGARVVVRVEALNTSERDNVAVVDPLPAGLEPVNTHLAVAERAATGAAAASDRWDHVQMRDQEAEAFANVLAAASHSFAYTARATTPGVFIAAPAKAEEMYAPETFGRSNGEVVVVE